MEINFKFNTNQLSIDWKEEDVKNKLRWLAKAKKYCHWIQADLSLKNSSYFTRLIFRMAKCFGLHHRIGNKWHKIDLTTTQTLLKNLQQKIRGREDLTLLFKRAVANYNIIVSKPYRVEIAASEHPQIRNEEEQHAPDLDLDTITPEECPDLLKTCRNERVREILLTAEHKLKNEETSRLNENLIRTIHTLFTHMDDDQIYMCLPVFFQNPTFIRRLWGLTPTQLTTFATRLARENPKRFLDFHHIFLDHPFKSFNGDVTKKELLEAMYHALPEQWFNDTERNYQLLKKYQSIDIVQAQPFLRRLHKTQLSSLVGMINRHAQKREDLYPHLQEVCYAARDDSLSCDLIEALFSKKEWLLSHDRQELGAALLCNISVVPSFSILQSLLDHAFGLPRESDGKKYYELVTKDQHTHRMFPLCVLCFLLSHILQTSKQQDALIQILSLVESKQEILVSYAIKNLNREELCLLLKAMAEMPENHSWGELLLSGVLKEENEETIEAVFRTYWPLKMKFNTFPSGCTASILPLVDSKPKYRAVERSLSLLSPEEKENIVTKINKNML